MEILRILPILCLVIGVELNGNGNSRILNGQDSDVLPYQVFLFDLKGMMCGGSLIKPDLVLTAEHCADGNPINVTAGISNLQEKGEKRAVESIVKHETADLALLKVHPPFEESDKIKPIQINDVFNNLDGKEVLISGWGRTTTANPSRTSQLQALNMIIKNEDVPSKFIYDGIISMLSSEGKGSCFGDSGGPAVLKGKDDLLVGVASAGTSLDANMQEIDHPTRDTVCGKDANNGKQWPYMLSFYVDVFEYADWIKDKINKNNGSGEECYDIWNLKRCTKKKRQEQCYRRRIAKHCKKTCDSCHEKEACEDRIATNRCEKKKAKGKCDKKRTQKRCQMTCGLCD